MYKKLYYIMFNAASDAVNAMDSGDTEMARRALVTAQRLAEEKYIE